MFPLNLFHVFLANRHTHIAGRRLQVTLKLFLNLDTYDIKAYHHHRLQRLQKNHNSKY